MPNSNIEALTPEFWFASFVPIDEGMYDLQNMVSRDVETTISRQGDTVNIPIMPDAFTPSDWDTQNDPAVTNISQEVAQVTLSQSKTVAFKLDSKELSRKPYDLISIYGKPAAEGLIREVNKYIYAGLLATGNFVDGVGGLTEDTLTDLRTLMNKNLVSSMGRKMITSPDDSGVLLKRDAFKLVNQAGTGEGQYNGMLGRKSGFDIWENNAIETYTPADLTGTINNVAGYIAGDKTMLVAGFADAATPIRPGDIFTVATEVGTPKHTVISTVQTAGNTTSITFEPALVSAVANGDAIAVSATRSLVGFIPSAYAFAARTYDVLPDNAGVKQSVMMVRGLPVRVSVYVTSNLGVRISMDLIYGGKLVKPSRVARIIR